ncbi:MAG TPA: tetratricopeptide repeat protein, partial [Candidatus Methanoperedens sp.]
MTGAIMAVVYQAQFQGHSITRIMPDGTQDTGPLDQKEIQKLDEICRDYSWNKSPDLSLDIGKRLFAILNGDRQSLIRALNEADERGEYLQVIIKGEGSVNLPFELLHYNDFLIPSKMHLIRRVSERGIKKTMTPEDRPLKVLLMACSPQDVSPVLEFEKEEDTILEVTKDLPIEIDVEDTGSLEGLGERLATTKYDIVHITGHADINEKGVPFFLMEDEEGQRHDVVPSMLWEKLDLNMPRLVFLSGCRTGQAPEHAAAMSFAQYLAAGRVPSVLGWGLPVTDVGARAAAVKLYHEFSRGENILETLRRTRKELLDHYQWDWSILRLFSDGTSPDVALVKREQKKRLKPGELQYTYLESSQVKILTKGFIGRRRQIQKGLRCLKKDWEKVGLLLHGTGGLGKSCLAGKLCERFKDHALIIVHGELNAYKFGEALKDGFFRCNDNDGLKALEIKEEMPDKIRRLCSSVFQQRNYLIILDDFEKNLAGIDKGNPEVCADAVPILEALLRFLPYSGKMTQVIITSRYTFPLTLGGKDVVREKLESIGLTSFREADERKKVSELLNIAGYPDPEIRQQLIKAGLGNPRLMEYLDTLIGEVKGLDITLLLSRIRNEQDEFVQDLILRQILEAQPEDFQTFLRRCAVYGLPVLKEGIGSLCGDLKDWDSLVEKAVKLSLMEKDSIRKDYMYWVTPLLRENLFKELEESEKKKSHEAAVAYYQNILSKSYEPISSAELIEHALYGGLLDIAIEESGHRFLPYLRNSLAYNEALEYGEHVHSHISEIKRNDKFSDFMFELGWIHDKMGNAKQAIEYYEQALSIDKEVYGERHPNVAIRLNNIGGAWHALGDSKKAISYYEQALSIDKEVYGERHPDVAIDLSNIGAAWDALGDSKKAISYYDQALSIDKEVYGKRHPNVAIRLNNIGAAWDALGDSKKAISYYDQALSI